MSHIPGVGQPCALRPTVAKSPKIARASTAAVGQTSDVDAPDSGAADTDLRLLVPLGVKAHSVTTAVVHKPAVLLQDAAGCSDRAACPEAHPDTLITCGSVGCGTFDPCGRSAG